jgi:hypothetical protein
VSKEPSNQVQSLSALRTLVSQSETGREVYLYPHLEVGDMWWIPDEITGFSTSREKHPWVIVNGYSPYTLSIVACPRTSSFRPKDSIGGIVTPQNLLPGLDKKGLLLLSHRRIFTANEFTEFDYIGRLPEQWITQMHDFYKSVVGGSIK